MDTYISIIESPHRGSQMDGRFIAAMQTVPPSWPTMRASFSPTVGQQYHLVTVVYSGEALCNPPGYQHMNLFEELEDAEFLQMELGSQASEQMSIIISTLTYVDDQRGP